MTYDYDRAPREADRLTFPELADSRLSQLSRRLFDAEAACRAFAARIRAERLPGCNEFNRPEYVRALSVERHRRIVLRAAQQRAWNARRAARRAAA